MKRVLLFLTVILNTALLPETVNGYLLPPEPDPAINTTTLLGVDSNDNGVRDDVERWLILKYQKHHRMVTEIALQTGRAFQFMLADPTNAEANRKKINGAQDCNFYFKDYAQLFGEPVLIDHEILNDDFNKHQLNTAKRINAYLEYDSLLSGGVYRFSHASEKKKQCDFDVDTLLEE